MAPRTRRDYGVISVGYGLVRRIRATSRSTLAACR